MGEGCESEGIFGTPEGVGCDAHVADGPPEADLLLSRHGFLAFFEGGDGEGVGEGKGGSRLGFEEEVVGYAAVFVFVTSPLANALDMSC